MLGWLSGSRQIEVAASNTVDVPSRLPSELRAEHATLAAAPDFAAQFRCEFQNRPDDDSDSLVEHLCRESKFVIPPLGGRSFDTGIPLEDGTTNDLPETLQSLLVELTNHGVPDDLAQELLLRLRISL